MTFYMENISKVKKIRKAQKKFWSKFYTFASYIAQVAHWFVAFCLLKRKLEFWLFPRFFINNLYLQGHQNEGLVEINGFSIKKPRKKH